MPYQTLQEFLKLKTAEKISLKPLLELSEALEQGGLSSQEQVALASEIEKIDFALLIRAALGNPKLNTLCKHPSLNDIWNEKWRLCGLNPPRTGEPPQAGKPIHEYKPQSTLHTFELLKGIFVYGQYKRHLKAEESIFRAYAPSYLQLAAYLGYFPALGGLCKQALAQNSLNNALFYASKAAELYWTPGYFLLAITTYTLARQDHNESFYQTALLQLIIAEKLMPHAENMINNAYQGKSVATALAEAGLSDLIELKQELARLAGLSMPWVTTTLYKQAEKEAKKIVDEASSSNKNEDRPGSKEEMSEIEISARLSL
ncbi:TPA: DUF5630 domain-containing protein [Legionella feeleii]